MDLGYLNVPLMSDKGKLEYNTLRLSFMSSYSTEKNLNKDFVGGICSNVLCSHMSKIIVTTKSQIVIRGFPFRSFIPPVSNWFFVIKKLTNMRA